MWVLLNMLYIIHTEHRSIQPCGKPNNSSKIYDFFSISFCCANTMSCAIKYTYINIQNVIWKSNGSHYESINLLICLYLLWKKNPFCSIWIGLICQPMCVCVCGKFCFCPQTHRFVKNISILILARTLQTTWSTVVAIARNSIDTLDSSLIVLIRPIIFKIKKLLTLFIGIWMHGSHCSNAKPSKKKTIMALRRSIFLTITLIAIKKNDYWLKKLSTHRLFKIVWHPHWNCNILRR